ncbi:MAG: PAS domain S-box protein [Candidatus Thorarchaeota archaeon]
MAIRVLFVDDNENMLKVVKQYIEQLDPEFEIVAVDSAEKGLGELDSRYFSVIVSDYQMPFMDGLEFLEKVRENHSDIPFIIFTGRSREEIAIKALNLGAAYYVEKGGDPKSQYQELVHIIRSLVIMRETIERHQVVFDHALEGIFIVDRESRKGYAANRAFYEMTGYSPADLADLSVDKIHPTEDLAHVVDEFEFQAAGLKKVAEKIPVLRKDGSVLIANITSNAITIGGKTYVLGLFSDISSQLTVQEALAESEEHFRLIAENSSDVIFTLDLDLNRTYLSPSVSNLRGLSKEESLSQTWAEIITPESLERMIQTLGPHIQELRDGIIPEYPISIELEMFHSQKGTIWVETTASPIFDSHGKPRGIVGITRDISHRISTESALKQSEERYRRLYENISDGVVNLDPAGRVVFCNDRLLQMFGYERDEVIGNTIGDILV